MLSVGWWCEGGVLGVGWWWEGGVRGVGEWWARDVTTVGKKRSVMEWSSALQPSWEEEPMGDTKPEATRWESSRVVLLSFVHCLLVGVRMVVDGCWVIFCHQVCLLYQIPGTI